MDFTVPEHLPVISTYSMESAVSATIMLTGTVDPISFVWPAANRALHVPITIRSEYLVKTLWWLNGTTASGNVDCGIYSAGGTLLTSIGSTAQAGTSTLQAVTLGTAILLSPGAYILGLALSSGTATVFSPNQSPRFYSAAGVTQQATAFPLPATYSPAAVASNCYPVFGIASTTTL